MSDDVTTTVATDTTSTVDTSPTETITTETTTAEPTWQSPITATPEGKIIIDGEEADFTAEEIRNIRELRKAGHQRLEEARKLAEQYQNVDLEAVKKAEREAYEKELLTQWEEQQKLQAMSEYERALYERDQRIAQFERERQAAEQARAQELEHSENQKIAQQIEHEFIKAMDAGELPKNYQYLELMAKHKRAGYNNGIDLPPAEVAALALEESASNVRDTIKFYENKPAKVLEFLGDDAMRIIRKAILEDLKAKGAPSVKIPVAPKSEEESSEERERDPGEHWHGGWGVSF
jgi:hypothetical protein